MLSFFLRSGQFVPKRSCDKYNEPKALKFIVWTQSHSLCSFKIFKLEVKCIYRSISGRVWSLIPAVNIVSFCLQPKEKGSTRVHALNNVNKALQVLQKNNVSGDPDRVRTPWDSSLNTWVRAFTPNAEKASQVFLQIRALFSLVCFSACG